MKLLVISSNSPYAELAYVKAPPGGAERGLRLLAEHAAATCEVTYLSTAHTRFRPFPALVAERISGVEVVHLIGPSVPGFQRRLHARRRRAWLAAVERVARERGCDVVLSYATVPDTFAAVSAKATVTGLKVVEWMAGRGWELHLDGRPDDLETVRTAFEGKDATLFETRALRDYTDEAERRHGLRRAGKDVFVQFAAASPARRSPGHAQASGTPPLVLCAAAFKTGSKRQDILVEAWPAVLRSAGPARLVLTGEGPTRAACEARACELGVSESVEFPGVVSWERLGEYLADAALAVLPTEFEGRPQAVIEAVEARVPVVVSDIPAHRELFGEDSLLAEACLAANTPASFAERISGLLSDQEARAEVLAHVEVLAASIEARRSGALDLIVEALAGL